MQTMAAAEQLTLFADSILRNGALATAGTYTSKRSNSELVASLRSLFIGILPDPELEASPDEPPSHKWDPKTRSLYIPAPESLERTSLESAREDLDVTAKFFYLAPEPSSCSLHALPPLPASWARDALDRLNEATGLAEVDTFILSFPGIIYPEDATNGANGCGGCDDENARSAGGVDGIVDERELTRAAFEAYVVRFFVLVSQVSTYRTQYRTLPRKSGYDRSVSPTLPSSRFSTS